MSTRATYGFNVERNAATFYIHHDGYPAGAAMYFWRALKIRSTKDPKAPYRSLYSGGIMEQFIRANNGAEFTQSHDIHGDTVFRYYVSCDNGNWNDLKLRCDTRTHRETWKIIFTGSLWTFVNRNAPESDWDKDFSPIYLDTPIGPATLQMVSKKLEESRAELAAYKERHPTMTGNIHSMETFSVKPLEDWIKEIHSPA